eukprot:jgi/Ulvmu1/5798/UM025_0053.1
MSEPQQMDDVQAELSSHGMTVEKTVASSQGLAILETSSRSGSLRAAAGDATTAAAAGKALVFAYSKDGITAHAAGAMKLMLLYSSLVHPHLVQLLSTFRTRSLVCLRLQHCNGGCLFVMARRGGAAGLPLAAAIFLIQQLILATEFLHLFQRHLSWLNPQNILINWNSRGIPIVKVLLPAFPGVNPESMWAELAGEAAAERKAQRQGTMWTAPHRLRARACGDDDGAEAYDARFNIACDVWAIMTSLYCILYAEWPFSKAQIAQWPGVEAAAWDDDKRIPYTRSDGIAVEGAPVESFHETFASGGLTSEEFASKLGSLDVLTATAWFQKDLPEGASGMTEVARTKTEQRRGSPQFAALSSAISDVFDRARRGCRN